MATPGDSIVLEDGEGGKGIPYREGSFLVG
jgi:hypothetical protein